MIRVFRGVLYVMMGLIVTAAVLTALVVWTSSGLRMAIAVADDYLPEALDLGRVRGTLASGLVVEDGAWRDRGVIVEIGRLELELAGLPLVRGDLRLDRLQASDVVVEILPGDGAEPEPDEPAGPFRFSMPVPLEIRDGRIERVDVNWPGDSRRIDLITLGAAVRGPVLRVERLNVGSDWLELQVEGRARFERPYPARLQATWRYRAGADQDFAGSGRLEGDADGWALTHRLLDPEPVRTEGTIELGGKGLRARLRNDFSRLEVRLPEDRDVAVEEGSLTVEGWLEAFSFEADARLVSAGLPTTQASLAGGGSVEAITIERLELTSEAGGLAAEGRVELAAEPRWNVTFAVDELEPQAWGAPVVARATMRGTSNGYWRSGEEHEISVALESLDGTYRGQGLTGQGAIALRNSRLLLDGFDVGLGENRVMADGTVGMTGDIELDLDVDIRAPALGQFWPDLGGSLNGRLRVRGRPPFPVIDGQLTGRDLAWRDIRAVEMELVAEAERAAGRPGASLQLRQVTAGESQFPALELDLQGTPGDNVVAIRVEAFDAVLAAEGAGALRGNVWTGTLRRLETTRPGLGEWRLAEPAGLTVSPAAAEITRACLVGGADQRLCVAGRYDPAEGARGRIDVERLPLAVMAPVFPADSRFDGDATGMAEFSWRDGKLDGDATLRVADGLVRAVLNPEESATLTIRSLQARATIEQNRMSAGATLDLGSQGDGELSLEAADLLDPDGVVSGRLRTDFRDLSLVSILVPEFEDVAGRVTGEVTVSGTRRQPSLNGEIRLQDGSFLFTEAGIEITEVEIVGRQESPGVIEYQGSARSGEGRVAITGTTQRPAPDAGWVSRLSIEGDNFLIVRLPDIQATASPAFELLVDDQRLELSGTVAVPTADVTLRAAGPGAVRPSPDVVVHGAEEAEERRAGPAVSIDVRAQLGDDVYLQGFGLETGLTGALRLTGGSQRPWLGFGELSLQDARYEAYGQKLAVERGEIAFSGPLDNPSLNIRAVRQTDDVLAGIYIRGTVRSPESVVFSEPPLPDAEALSYLLTGRPLAGTSTGDSDMLSKAALSLGLSRAGAIASGIGQEVGLDTLAVEGGAEDGRVLAGKRLTEDLYLEYAWGIFDQIGTLLVRYDLSDRLRLESHSGEQHAVDLIYRVEQD